MSSKRKKQKRESSRKLSYFASLTWSPAAKIAMQRFFLDLPLQGHMSIQDRLNFLFSSKVREIEFFRVTKPGTVRGTLIATEAINEGKGVPSRELKVGELVLIRSDDLRREYDIQVFENFSDESESRWYKLTGAQVSTLTAQHLERISEPNDE